MNYTLQHLSMINLNIVSLTLVVHSVMVYFYPIIIDILSSLNCVISDTWLHIILSYLCVCAHVCVCMCVWGGGDVNSTLDCVCACVVGRWGWEWALDDQMFRNLDIKSVPGGNHDGQILCNNYLIIFHVIVYEI